VANLPPQGIDTTMSPLLGLDKVLIESLDLALEQDQRTGKTTNCGKWKRRFIQTVDGEKGMFEERKRNTWWLALAAVYEAYREELHRRGFYDYSDMVIEVISQLEQQADMRAAVQERFLYVLIDEFQDTNAAQLRLAQLVADHQSNAGQPNLMAVGDDDQSIYKFNGAELNNLLSFKRSYPSAQLIVLTDNYRSSQAVLNTAARVVSQIEDRLVTRLPAIEKKLVAKNEPEQKGTIEHRSYANREQQLSAIARDIAAAHANGVDSLAVLARGHASLRELSSLLARLEVPVTYEAQNNIFEHPAIQQLYILAQLLVAIRQGDQQLVSSLLSKTLRHPMWNIPAGWLWQLATDNYRQAAWLNSMLSSPHDRLQQVAHWLQAVSDESAHQPLPVILEYLIGLRAGEQLTSPLLAYYSRPDATSGEHLRTLSALRLLRASLAEFSPHVPTLEEFISFITVSLETGQGIADETSFVTGDNAVELLTVHKAKGLEFDTVYIIDAIEQNWQPNRTGRKPPANLPLQPPGDDADDYARLLYVAITRAKRSLIITSYREDSVGRPVLASPLLNETMPVREVAPADHDTAITILEEQLPWPDLIITDLRPTLAHRIQNYQLSATALLDFLDLTKGGPQYFMERHILHLPEAVSAQAAFGTAMHAALEYAQILTNSNRLRLTLVLRRFDRVLREQYLPAHEEARYRAHGQQLLKKLLASQTFWLPKGSLPEQVLRDVRVGQAHLTGTIDRLDITKQTATIVDYKTGQPLASLHTRDQTKVVKAWRQRSQLIFYNLLLQHSDRLATPSTIKGQIIYLEAATARELVREYTPSSEELQQLSQLIQVVWQRICGVDMPDVSSYDQTMSGISAFIADLLQIK
jgi:DNA helicase-2/ATP-dependent DNA helicase PcrA